MERHERVQHGGQRDEREEAGADLADAVTEVEQADGQATEDDGEVEPAEEGAFVGEEDFGLDAGGEGDALACRKQALVGSYEPVHGVISYPALFGGEVGSTLCTM